MADAETQAQLIVDRGKHYGNPWTMHGAIGKAWAGILSAHFDDDIPNIPPHVVAQMMSVFKLTRSARPVFHKDNYDDASVYMRFAQEMQEIACSLSPEQLDGVPAYDHATQSWVAK